MQIQPTPYNDINTLLEILLSGIQNILGQKLIALYLCGSLVTGDFDPESSDFDLIAVISSDLDARETTSLQKMHQDFASAHPQWDDRIEVIYPSIIGLKTYRTQVSKMAVISPGEPFHIIDAGKEWLMNWYMVREKGSTLFGPLPDVLIQPVSKAEFLQAIQDHARAWRMGRSKIHLRKEQAYAILTMCRALYTLTTGEMVSKKQAAIWAEKELPEWASLIQNALFWRKSWRDKDIDHEATLPETQQFILHIINLCETIS